MFFVRQAIAAAITPAHKRSLDMEKLEVPWIKITFGATRAASTDAGTNRKARLISDRISPLPKAQIKMKRSRNVPTPMRISGSQKDSEWADMLPPFINGITDKNSCQRGQKQSEIKGQFVSNQGDGTGSEGSDNCGHIFNRG